MTDYKTTIGLEIHVELKTNTKMFCGCEVGFGGDPNSRVCPVCLGHPGTLPVPNETAIEFTTKIAMALGCEIAAHSVFHRKNYFYPDMPKNYQISQYDIPIGSGGYLEIETDGRKSRVGITRVHLEEDTGKSLHVGGGGRIADADYSLEDFNRAGTPLVEIVTEPDITSPDEARTFAMELRSILQYLDVSDVRMEEGSLRIDANVSVALEGEKGTKIEIKNMNSMRSLHRALIYEVKRQSEALSKGEKLQQMTRHWDEKKGVTTPGRVKEYAFDYRYFPEPDLVPIEPQIEWLRQLQEELPSLPAEHRSRLTREIGLSAHDAAVLTSAPSVIEFFESARAVATKADAKQLANWVANDLTGLVAERNKDVSSSTLDPAHLAKVVDLVAAGVVSKGAAVKVLAEVIDTGEAPEKLVEQLGLEQVSDREAMSAAVDQAIAENPEIADRIRAGEDKPFGFMVGQVMKATKGKGNPGIINELLREKLRN